MKQPLTHQISDAIFDLQMEIMDLERLCNMYKGSKLFESALNETEKQIQENKCWIDYYQQELNYLNMTEKYDV